MELYVFKNKMDTALISHGALSKCNSKLIAHKPERCLPIPETFLCLVNFTAILYVVVARAYAGFAKGGGELFGSLSELHAAKRLAAHGRGVREFF